MKRLLQMIALTTILVHFNDVTSAQKSINPIYDVGQILNASRDFDILIDSAWYVKSNENGKAILKVSISLINKSKEAVYWKTSSPLGFKIQSPEGLEYTKAENYYEYGGSAFSQMAHPGVGVQPMSKKTLTEVFEVPREKSYFLQIYQMRISSGWSYVYSKLRWKIKLNLQ